jgi:hypothetical protein
MRNSQKKHWIGLVLSIVAGLSLWASCKDADSGSDRAARDRYIQSKAAGPGPADAGSTPSVTPDGGGSVADSAPTTVTRTSKLAKRVQITVVDGKDLPDLDDGPGVTDAYVILEYDGARQKTSVNASQAPKWGDSFVFEIRRGATLSVTVMDEDPLSDEKIGVTTVSLPKIRVAEEKMLDVLFRDGDNGKVRLKLVGL